MHAHTPLIQRPLKVFLIQLSENAEQAQNCGSVVFPIFKLPYPTLPYPTLPYPMLHMY
jgi:hypothetical protein